MIAVLVAVALSGVQVTQETYNGWTGAYRVSNAYVDLVVVPQIGRIMRFGFKNGRNVLYENEQASGFWRNYGGDKLWPAPQSMWNWPSEAGYDSTPWMAQPISDGIVMRSSKPGEKTGVRFERRIHLDPRASAVSIENYAINDNPRPLRIAVWENCAVGDPKYCVLPAGPGQWHPYDNVDVSSLITQMKDKVFIRRDPMRGLKYGCASPSGWVSANLGTEVVELRAPFTPGKEYVDGGKAQQLYTSSDPDKYAELEITGPVQTVPPHGRIELVTALDVFEQHT